MKRKNVLPLLMFPSICRNSISITHTISGFFLFSFIHPQEKEVRVEFGKKKLGLFCLLPFCAWLCLLVCSLFCFLCLFLLVSILHDLDFTSWDLDMVLLYMLVTRVVFWVVFVVVLVVLPL